MGAELGFRMAADRPCSRASRKKAELTASRRGRPKDTLDTPRLVRQPSSRVMRSTVSNVTAAALWSALMVRARGSKMRSSLGMP